MQVPRNLKQNLPYLTNDYHQDQGGEDIREQRHESVSGNKRKAGNGENGTGAGGEKGHNLHHRHHRGNSDAGDRKYTNTHAQ